MIDRVNKELLSPRTYGSIAYLLAAGVLGTAEFVFLVTGISLGVGLTVTLVGIPILIACVYAWGWLAELERRVIHALTGRRIANPTARSLRGAGGSGCAPASPTRRRGRTSSSSCSSSRLAWRRSSWPSSCSRSG